MWMHLAGIFLLTALPLAPLCADGAQLVEGSIHGAMRHLTQELSECPASLNGFTFLQGNNVAGYDIACGMIGNQTANDITLKCMATTGCRAVKVYITGGGALQFCLKSSGVGALVDPTMIGACLGTYSYRWNSSGASTWSIRSDGVWTVYGQVASSTGGVVVELRPQASDCSRALVSLQGYCGTAGIQGWTCVVQSGSCGSPAPATFKSCIKMAFMWPFCTGQWPGQNPAQTSVLTDIFGPNGSPYFLGSLCDKCWIRASHGGCKCDSNCGCRPGTGGNKCDKCELTAEQGGCTCDINCSCYTIQPGAPLSPVARPPPPSPPVRPPPLLALLPPLNTPPPRSSPLPPQSTTDSLSPPFLTPPPPPSQPSLAPSPPAPVSPASPPPLCDLPSSAQLDFTSVLAACGAPFGGVSADWCTACNCALYTDLLPSLQSSGAVCQLNWRNSTTLNSFYKGVVDACLAQQEATMQSNAALIDQIYVQLQSDVCKSSPVCQSTTQFVSKVGLYCSTSPAADTSTAPLGAVLGGAVGGGVGLAALISLAWWCLVRRRRRQAQPALSQNLVKHTPQPQPSGSSGLTPTLKPPFFALTLESATPTLAEVDLEADLLGYDDGPARAAASMKFGVGDSNGNSGMPRLTMSLNSVGVTNSTVTTVTAGSVTHTDDQAAPLSSGSLAHNGPGTRDSVEGDRKQGLTSGCGIQHCTPFQNGTKDSAAEGARNLGQAPSYNGTGSSVDGPSQLAPTSRMSSHELERGSSNAFDFNTGSAMGMRCGRMQLGHLAGLQRHDAFVKQVAPHFRWCSGVPPDATPVEEGVSSHELSASATTPGVYANSDVVQLSPQEVAQQVELVAGGLIDRGGTACVYKCKWPARFGQRGVLAAKVIRGSDSRGGLEGQLQAFKHEARVLSQIVHPNVVRLYGYCLELPAVCLLLELLPGTLKTRLYGADPKPPRHLEPAQQPAPPSMPSVLAMQLSELSTLNETRSENDFEKQLPLTAVEALRLCADVSLGLAFLHEGMGASRIMHRDLKPANILINSAGRAKLSDLGLAREHQDSDLITDRVGAGTLRYMAPELLQSATHSITNKVDIYSLGVLLWELIAHQMPFHGNTDPQVVLLVASNQRPSLKAPQNLPGHCQGPVVGPGSTLHLFQELPHLALLINACWQETSHRRPCATAVHNQLLRILQQIQPVPPPAP